MESLLSPFSLLLSFLGLLFLIRVAAKGRSVGTSKAAFDGASSSSSCPLPPGPRGLPVIGSIHLLAGGLPHRILAGLAHRHGPLMLLRLGQVGLAVASSAEAAEEVLKTHDLNFAYRPALAVTRLADNGLGFSPYGGHWRHLRKVATVELLSAQRVRSLAALREEQVLNMIDGIRAEAASRAPVNLSERLLSMTNSIVTGAAVGRTCRQQGKLVQIAKEATKLTSGFAVADLFPSLRFVDVLSGVSSQIERVRREFEEILDEIIRDKQETMSKGKGGDVSSAKKEEDILDVLLRITDDNDQDYPITTNNAKVVIFEVLVGGTETSASTVAWAMSELVRNPKIMEKAQREIREALKGKPNVEESDLGQFDYLKLVIKETFRLHLPGPLLLPRIAKDTCQLMGYKVPAGTRMVINAWALARDPRYWAEPERFTPERFEENPMDYKGTNFAYLPFGGGRRICPGMVFGLASIELALAQLLFHFDWSLPGGMKPEELDMTETFGATANRKSDLCLLATPHFPTNAN